MKSCGKIEESTYMLVEDLNTVTLRIMQFNVGVPEERIRGCGLDSSGPFTGSCE